MNAHRELSILPTSEITPLLPLSYRRTPTTSDYGTESESKERDGPSTSSSPALADPRTEPIPPRWTRSLESLYEGFDRLTGRLGWTPPTFMAFFILAMIFTLTSYTCVWYGPLVGFPILGSPYSASSSSPFFLSYPFSTSFSSSTSSSSAFYKTHTNETRSAAFLPPIEISNFWGAYSPYFPVREYVPPPRECRINQVNIIQRHGARFPTVGANERIRGALSRLQSAHTYLDPRLEFLKEYEYPLGVNELVPFGAFQSAEAGAKTWERYRKLVRKGKAGLPFVRASGSERVIDSATNWTAGFADANNNIFEPKLAVIIPEHLNDTLEDHMCPNAGTPEPQTAIWTEIFAQPIADRLNALAPGANLSAADAASLIPLCAFESVAMERPSRFCALFSGEEFEGYEYLADLEKYYNRGWVIFPRCTVIVAEYSNSLVPCRHGQPLGPVQGVGYINELLARLTNTPVHDHTSTNRTLTSSPHTFPLDRTIYADFSHDNLMVAVFSAMGLFKQDPEGRNGEVDGHLDPERMDRRRTWVTSRITPFSARMVVERMTCRGRVEGRVGEEGDQEVFNGFIDVDVDEDEDEDERVERATKGKAKRRGRNYVRVLVNDAVQPLEFCGGDGDGLCTLERFVDSQWYARKSGDGDWEKCFEGVEREGDF
ncbi:hypothetical protein CC2G_009864 [Coprinopsis cinerea AmutBmut pab1-1]|nr:hypothetical protein CC2G_009864 [Coprinopsis cinerea AmutBmut pab1-1]